MVSAFEKYRLPWYGWILSPLVLPVALLVLLVIAPLVIIFTPYFWLFPERHRHTYDGMGSTHQRKRLAEWRVGYSRLSFLGRIERAFRKHQRRRQANHLT
jgi:hypothetical protein